MNALAWVFSGSDVGSILWMVVGIVVCFAIVFFIMRQVGAPAIAFTVLYVLAAIITLLCAITYFFGSPHSGGVYVR